MHGYCAAGGKVLDKLWVPMGNKDFSSVIARIPDDVDAVYVALGGSDAVNFMTQYEQAGGNKPLIAGSITVDASVLGYQGKKPDFVVGTIAAGPMADRNETPAWKNFVANYKKSYPDGFQTPSIFATLYYINTKALLEGLRQTGGNMSKVGPVLAKLELDSPLGKVRIDQNRNAIANNFITEVAKDASGQLYNKVVNTIGNVGQDLGLSREQFLKTGVGTRDNPPLCK
jgi:branched-chain amino acid transport system substrate-binding protein